MVEDDPSHIHPFRIAQISTTTSQLVILPKAYKDFEDIFSITNAGHLASHKDHNYASDLIND